MNPALFRRLSSDAAIWDSVVNRNEYRFPDKFEPNSLCLDIGSNTGAAAYAMLQRGAAKVIGFEPDPDNFSILRKQLKTEIKDGRFECYPLAVVGGSGFSWRTFSGTVVSDGQINHGGAFLFTPEGGDHGLGEFIINRPFQVPCIGFEEIIALTGEFDTRLLKLDCEGSEREILPTDWLDEFTEVVGEYHPSGSFTKQSLVSMMDHHGYKTELVPHPGSALGLFFATRK